MNKFDLILANGTGNHKTLNRRVVLLVDGVEEDAVSVKLDSQNARDKQANAWAKTYGIDADAVRDKLRKAALIATAETQQPQQATDADELDVSRLVRPELFHTPDVSGIAIPIVHLAGREPVGQWRQYLRWPDGRRECRELRQNIELSDSSHVWFCPIPAEPSPMQRPGWSAESRRAWLNGADAPNPAEVFKRLCEAIARYLEFQPEAAAGCTATLALWSMLSYAYPAWSAIPYLSVGGSFGSGKSTVFHVLNQLVFRSLPSSNMSAPCLFRTLHEQGGVLLLDEAERLKDGTPDAGEIRSILLSGYKRGSPAMRLEKVGEKFQRVAFDVFGPKAIAGIASLPEALSSRCIRVMMFRADPDSPKPKRRIESDDDTWQQLRDDLHILALEHGPRWPELAHRSDVVPAMHGRDYEVWQPILAMASWIEEHGAGGLLELVQEHAQRVVESGQDDSVPEVDELLIRLLAEHVQAGSHKALKASELLRQASDAAPDLFGSEKNPRFSAKGIGTILRRYGLGTRKGHGNIGRTFAYVSMDMIRRVERNYGFDVGTPLAIVPQRAACTAEIQ